MYYYIRGDKYSEKTDRNELNNRKTEPSANMVIITFREILYVTTSPSFKL